MSKINAFLKTIEKLRSPEGCSWDRKQTHDSLIPYLSEESAEVIEAIRMGDNTEIKNELGDLLLQIVLHAQIAKENGIFDFDDVVTNVNDKMIRRHPHVFAGVKYANEVEQKLDWQRIKAEEKVQQGIAKSVLDNAKLSLSGLMSAYNLQKKAAEVGFDWHDLNPVLAKIEEELAEVKVELKMNNAINLQKEIGDLLFAVVNLARHCNIDPEVAVNDTNTKFKKRFQYIEEHINQPLAESTLEELDELWNQSKKEII